MKTTPTTNDYSALVAKAKTGDQAAFAELYDRTAPELYRCIRAMTRDEDLAWDIQQDSYLRAYDSLDTLENDAAFFPWLRRIAVNITARKMSQRRTLTFTELAGDDDDDAFPELPDLSPESQPELALDRKETSRLVQEILSKLPEEQQLIVGMRYYDELSIREIAETLNLSAGAVKAQLFHGRKKVETAVRELEKQGVKLYGLSPLPFLIALMKQMEPAEAAKQTAVKVAVAKGCLTAGAKTAALAAGASSAAPAAEAVVFHATRPFLSTAVGKIVLGVLCAGVVAGGAAGYRWAKNTLFEKSNPLPYVDTDEDLRNSTDAPTLPVEIDTTGEVEIEISRPLDTEPAESDAASAKYSGTCGENLTWRFDPETGTLTIEGSGAMQEYADYQSVPWSTLSQQITAIRLPDGLKTICDGAFSGSSVTNITIPDSVERIGAHAFYVCRSLSDVTIPDKVTQIGFDAFFDCSSLSSVKIGSGLAYIGDEAFSGCASLAEIDVSSANPNFSSSNGILFNKAQTELLLYPAQKRDSAYQIPDRVTTIGNFAFRNCTALEGVTIPDSVTHIGESAFYGCSALRNATIPDGVTDIGSNAFADTGLTYVIIPGSVKQIGHEAFCGCTNLSGVSIENGVISIGDYAFSGCSISTVAIPESVEQVGDYCFYHTTLTSASIGNGVTSIGTQAFGYYNDPPTYRKTEGFTLYGTAGSTAETYSKENGFSFVALDAVAGTELDVIFERMAQDEADRTGLDGSWSRELGGVTEVSTIYQVDGRCLAKVVRTVALTVTEAELAQAKQTGTITLNGQEYRLTESQEQFNEWMGWEESIFSMEEFGGCVIVGDTPYGKSFYGVFQADDVYLFAKEIGGVTSRIETVTNEDWVWLDGTTPVILGPGSGKFATCLAQIYHEYRQGKTAGYSKFESFPVWNLPLDQPLNIAYEAATIDLNDK
ncbi:MAG: DUF1846 family protein, partial [Oscillospiraceae bacterium]|nr:DUF1846 family protein [Oscillospiraceae bacterium]